MVSWPAHPQPLPDELFSSWIFRAARANGQKFFSLCYMVAPELRNIHHNYDYVINEDALKRYAKSLKTPYEQAFQTTLESYAGYLYETASASRNRKSSILCTGIQSKATQRFSLQVCPLCLSESEPYFRKKWRITFITVCSIHGCKLIDRCPQCFHPIRPLQNDIGNQKILYSGEITACHNCSFDLKKANVETADRYVLLETKWYESILENGYVVLGPNCYVYSFSFFNILKHLIGVTTNKNNLGLNCNSKPDLLPLNIRYKIICKLAGIFHKWPVSFVEFCFEFNIVYSDFTSVSKIKNAIPFWLDRIIKPQIYSPNLNPEDESVRSAMQYMKKKGMAINIVKINEFMGFEDSSVIKRVYKNVIPSKIIIR
ncbi:TniQ family protein [Moritella viscosa]|uniref:TniQ domain-containing protein n=1 Tax=Moritella viscosa TaxID=80854 RepID=A0A1K9ZVG8_9GAMM|nr:TniQ family protein [Moritella viscosa]SGZ03995.1 Putative uncharacterized protein [Moritella viscosa]